MSQFFQIHPDNPQARLIRQAVEIINKGEVVAYPTDSSYALGCQIGNKQALEQICRIRQVDNKHNFTLVCRDIAEAAAYASIDNICYRLIKSLTPGAYTFILPATRIVPKRMAHAKRKTIGIRIPDNAIVQAMLAELGQPMLTSTLQLPGDDMPLGDPYEIKDAIAGQVGLVIDGGYCGWEPTTVIELLNDEVKVVRRGKGVADNLET